MRVQTTRHFSLPRHLRTYLFLIIIGIFVAFPLAAVVITSFNRSGAILNFPPSMLTEPTLDNYTHLFSQPDLQLPRWLFNSFFVITTHTILLLIVCRLSSCSFLRMR